MAHTHTFEFGTAVLFLDSEKSVHLEGLHSRRLPSHNVTLFVKSPGDMFVMGRLDTLQARVKRAAEVVVGTSVGIVNLKSITLYDKTISSYATAVEVATDFVAAFQEQYNQLVAAEKKQSKKLKIATPQP